MFTSTGTLRVTKSQSVLSVLAAMWSVMYTHTHTHTCSIELHKKIILLTYAYIFGMENLIM